MPVQEMPVTETEGTLAKQYWDKEWIKRISSVKSGVCPMNHEKLCKVVYELAIRGEYAQKEKLDIGCGIGIHCMHLSLYHRSWREKWTGIDVSDKAVEFARSSGLNAIQSSIEDYHTDKRYGVFLLLDSFEHLTDTAMLAEKILELAEPQFTVFGNAPLFTGQKAYSDGIEREITINDISYFMKLLGIKEFYHEIWGAYGHPFLIFEGRGGK